MRTVVECGLLTILMEPDQMREIVSGATRIHETRKESLLDMAGKCPAGYLIAVSESNIRYALAEHPKPIMSQNTRR